MISFQQALDVVLLNKKNYDSEEVSILKSTGRILAVDVFADRGFPPYDRVTMDGISINTDQYENGRKSFLIENMQGAGAPQQKLISKDNCIEVMTGSILPENTNAVIPYEHCEIKDGIATINVNDAKPMQNVHTKNSDCKAGALLIAKHQKITASMIGLMASVGLPKIAVKRLPKVVVCSTGNELVAIDQHPQLHQVRRSNCYMLAAELLSYHIHAAIYHLPDDEAQMTHDIQKLLREHDVVLFSGAVSKGRFDYLPDVLKKLEMQTIFHQVAQRPGKPLLYGKFAEGQIVFGFPGNPVSTFVCYHQYFKPWLHACFSYSVPAKSAILNQDVCFKPLLGLHLLVSVTNVQGRLEAEPVNTSTSGDMVQLAKANAIITLPAEREIFKKGEVFDVNFFD